jgi:outer membrane protein assembly factor BamD
MNTLSTNSAVRSLWQLWQSACSICNYRGLRSFLLLAVMLLFTACAGNDEEDDSFIRDITEAYDTARTSMDNGNYRRAISIFEALQARFPFSELSTQIQLELMFAYYKSGAREQTIDAADTFIRENPTHPRVDYAHYIKGLIYFDQDPGTLERLFRKNTENRPPQDAELSFSSFNRLVERYPASPYAADAQQRMIFLKNRLAKYENTVARFYMRQGAYVAALNRAKGALENYHGSDSSADSLRIMIEAYEGLGMTDLAADTRRVLQANFPNDSD